MEATRLDEYAKTVKEITNYDWTELQLISVDKDANVYLVGNRITQGAMLIEDVRAYAAVIESLKALGAPVTELPKHTRFQKIISKLSPFRFLGYLLRPLMRPLLRKQQVEEERIHPSILFEKPEIKASSEKWVELLTPLAMRTRIAYALHVIESGIVQTGLASPQLKAVFDPFWNFVASSQMNIKEMEANLPTVLYSAVETTSKDSYDSEEKSKQLRDLYERLPPYLLRMLEWVYASADAMPYSTYLKNGIDCTVRVAKALEIAEEHGIRLPPLEPFELLSYDEQYPFAAVPEALAFRTQWTEKDSD